MTREHTRRKLAAILSADVKGYSRLMEEDEEATVRTITAYREVMKGFVHGQNGRIADAKGDNLLAEFPSVVDAVRCAVDIQKQLKVKNDELPGNRKMEFRIGINLGDVIEEEGTIYGDGVNIAARLEGLAEGGGICISRTAFDQVKNKVPVGYQYLGKQTVKNIADPVRVYKVLMEPEAVGKVIGEKERTQIKLGWKVAAVAAVLLLVVGGLVWNFYFRSPPIEPASLEKMAYSLPDKPSIAVLPFANMSDDPKQEYFSDGLTEEIITALSKVKDMFVIARNSTFTYKGKPVKVQTVAEDLGIRYVLEGSVRREKDTVRITAQLIDATTGHHLFSERYDRELKGIFALQDEIALKILTAVRATLTDGELAQIQARGVSNIDAYFKLLEAQKALQEVNKESNAQAQSMVKEALLIEPGSSRAHYVLACTQMWDFYFGPQANRRGSIVMGIKSAKKAIQLDEFNSYAYGILGILYVNAGDFDKAVENGEKGVSLEPNSAITLFYYGSALMHACRYQEAIPVLEKSLRLDPLRPISMCLMNLGLSYQKVGRYDESVRILNRLLKEHPNHFFGHLVLTATYSEMGRMDEAEAQAAKVLKMNPKFSLESWAKIEIMKNKADKARGMEALRKAGIPEKPPLPLPDKPSIAVLPFVNMSGDPEQEYFSDGITEEIITALSKIPKLFVIARNSTFTYKGKPVKVQQVGRELGIKYVLEGSVRKAEDQVRITAQLIDAKTGNHLWAERYDRDLKDIFAIQDEITLEIIKAMQLELTMGETARVTGKGTKNLDAYLKALQAQRKWLRMDKEGSIMARHLAREAIALDPGYGYPYAIVAWCYMLDVVRQYTRSPEESMRLAVEAIQKALALDVSDHRIHRVLSNLYVMQGKHDEAIASSKRALELCPGGAGPHENLGIALLFACRPTEAIPMLEKAIELDPFPPAVCHRNLAMAYLHVGRYEDAITEGKKAYQINRNDLSTPLGLVLGYAKLGRKEEARAAAAEVLRINPDFTLDSFAETRARMFAAKCHSDRVHGDVEFIRNADVGLK